jgi:hypothetical protein
VPPESVTVAVLFTWSLRETSRVAPLATETELIEPAAAPLEALRLSRPDCTATGSLALSGEGKTKHPSFAGRVFVEVSGD